MGVNRIDNQIVEELMEEVGMKESTRRQLLRSRLKWVGHVVGWKGNEWLTKRADALKVEVEEEEVDRD